VWGWLRPNPVTWGWPRSNAVAGNKIETERPTKTLSLKSFKVEEHLGHGFAAELICINTAMYLLVHK
jgi:hypothetical protein